MEQAGPLRLAGMAGKPKEGGSPGEPQSLHALLFSLVAWVWKSLGNQEAHKGQHSVIVRLAQQPCLAIRLDLFCAAI